MNHLRLHSLVKKILPMGSGLGKAGKGKPRFHESRHSKSPNSSPVHMAFCLEVQGQDCMGKKKEEKKSNQNGFSRRRKNKATWCVISGMSFAHRPLDDPVRDGLWRYSG